MLKITTPVLLPKVGIRFDRVLFYCCFTNNSGPTLTSSTLKCVKRQIRTTLLMNYRFSKAQRSICDAFILFAYTFFWAQF